MEKFTNPLERVRIASPCAADWDKMQGDARKRFCGECKMNVYNLSAMTKSEAETLLINSEGRLCARFYRRADGTILTQNCPVGWAKMKQRVSRIAAATFSLIVGFFGGLWSFNSLENLNAEAFKNSFVEALDDKSEKSLKIPEPLVDEPIVNEPKFLLQKGEVSFDDSLYTLGKNKTGLSKATKNVKSENAFVGRVEKVRSLEDEPVEAWIK